jgi:hypothetical protein
LDTNNGDESNSSYDNQAVAGRQTEVTPTPFLTMSTVLMYQSGLALAGTNIQSHLQTPAIRHALHQSDPNLHTVHSCTSYVQTHPGLYHPVRLLNAECFTKIVQVNSKSLGASLNNNTHSINSSLPLCFVSILFSPPRGKKGDWKESNRDH